MADQTGVAIHIATKAVESAARLQTELETLEDLLNWGLAAGISLTNYDAEISNSNQIMHTDGTKLNQFLGVVMPGIKSYMESTSVGGDTYAEIVQKVRGINS